MSPLAANSRHRAAKRVGAAAPIQRAIVATWLARTRFISGLCGYGILSEQAGWDDLGLRAAFRLKNGTPPSDLPRRYIGCGFPRICIGSAAGRTESVARTLRVAR